MMAFQAPLSVFSHLFGQTGFQAKALQLLLNRCLDCNSSFIIVLIVIFGVDLDYRERVLLCTFGEHVPGVKRENNRANLANPKENFRSVRRRKW